MTHGYALCAAGEQMPKPGQDIPNADCNVVALGIRARSEKRFLLPSDKSKHRIIAPNLRSGD